MNRTTKRVPLKEMNEAARFALGFFGVTAKWRIICLPYGRWRKLMTERAWLDKHAARNMSALQKLMMTEEGQKEIEESKELREKMEEALRLERQAGKEYGREISLDDYLRAAAYAISGPTERTLRKKMPFTHRLVLENKDADFLIFPNPSTTPNESLKENLKTVVHEVIHYVENLRDDKSAFASVERQAEEIVARFLGQEREF